MNAPARIAAVPYALRTFTAHRITTGGKDLSFSPRGFRTYEGKTLDALSLDDALAAAINSLAFDHKEILVIRERGRHVVNGRQGEPLDWLHVYAIKRRSQPDYVWEGHERKRINRLYADPICTIDGEALEINQP